MREFIAIDFETANPKRVSACAIGYAFVSNGEIVKSNEHLMKPVGGHAEFQSKIHGIKEEHTIRAPDFSELFSDIRFLFDYPLVGYSQFDKQVLNALFSHFEISMEFSYTDACAIAKQKYPELKNHKLKSLVKHFKLPSFKHHIAKDDAIACANIFLRLQENGASASSEIHHDEMLVFKGFIKGILADDEVNYKEAYELLYFLEDHTSIAKKYKSMFDLLNNILEDNILENVEAIDLTNVLRSISTALKEG